MSLLGPYTLLQFRFFWEGVYYIRNLALLWKSAHRLSVLHWLCVLWVKSKIMRQLKILHSGNLFCCDGLCVLKNDAEMYQRHMIFGPFCNTFASLFLTWPLYDFLLSLAKTSTTINRSVPNSSCVRVITDRWTDGWYQTNYLPCFAVDKYFYKNVEHFPKKNIMSGTC